MMDATNTLLRRPGPLQGVAAPAPTCATTTDAVIGYAVGSSLDEIAPFIRSLRSVFQGIVILVVNHDPTVLAYLSTHRVQVEIVRRRRLPWDAYRVGDRFEQFTRVLSRRTDLRDVVIIEACDTIFQSNPFASRPARLEVFMESDPTRPGVIIGPASAAESLCSALARSCRSRPALMTRRRDAEAAIALIADVDLVDRKVEPNDGRVATPGPRNALRLTNGLIVDPNGGASAIVRQYGRVPLLADHVRSRWGNPFARSRMFSRRW